MLDIKRQATLIDMLAMLSYHAFDREVVVVSQHPQHFVGLDGHHTHQSIAGASHHSALIHLPQTVHGLRLSRVPVAAVAPSVPREDLTAAVVAALIMTRR